MAMTRGQIKQRVRVYGRHLFGGDDDRDPFGLDFLVTDVANQVARATDCLVGRRILDLVEDQQEYCAPDVYRIQAVFRVDADTGDYTRLPILWNYERGLDGWRNEDASHPVEKCAVFGQNRIGVYPTPDAAVTGGLVVEGYAVPGDYWEYDVDGVGQAPTENDNCPLPDYSHEAVVYGVLAMRAKQKMDMAAAQMWDQEYRKHLGEVESNAAMYARRSGR